MRNLFMVPAAIIAVAGCTAQNVQQQSPAAMLAAAKVIVSEISVATVAGAAAYTGPDAAKVQATVAQLKAAADAFTAANVDTSNAKAAAQSVLMVLGQVSALAAPQIAAIAGPKAAAVPVAIAVLTAFVAALPDMPSAPPANS